MTNPLVRWAARPEVRDAVLITPAARELVARYVAGEDVAELVPVLASLLNKGLDVSIEYLGEPVEDLAGAGHNLDGYLSLIRRVGQAGIAQDAELSVRMNWLGLELGDAGFGFARDAARQIARQASNTGMLLTVDMTHAASVDATLDIWGQLHQDWPRTGITVQADLFRTPRDLAELATPGTRIRLCKGSFRESRQVAFRNHHEIDLAYVRSLRTLMNSQAIPLIATHDPRLIAISEELIRRSGRAPGSYEFQMLYGVRPYELRRLVDIGHIGRSYVPFGPGWYDYYLRRLADRPTTMALFARSLVGKR